jgi:hypothetical protein
MFLAFHWLFFAFVFFSGLGGVTPPTLNFFISWLAGSKPG